MTNNTEILDTWTRLWLMESEQAIPVDWIKDMVQSFLEAPKFNQKYLEEGQRTHSSKCCEYKKKKTIVQKTERLN